jgi:hypothetical protein
MGKYVKREDVLKKLKDVSKLADGKTGRAVVALLRASLEGIPYIVVEEKIKQNDKN